MRPCPVRRRVCVAGGALWLALTGVQSRAQGSAREAAILVAAPSLTGSIFARSVVVVARTPGGETIGLILNQPAGVDLPAELAGPPGDGAAAMLYRGGPLAPLGVFALVETDYASAATIQVTDGVVLSAGMSETRSLLRSPGTGRRRVFRGYAGWSPGQLGEEIRAGFWSAREATAELLFDAEPRTQWERLTAPYKGVSARAWLATV